MSKSRRFSLAVRVLAGLSVAVLIGTLVVWSMFGVGLVSAGLATASAVGLVVPCVLAGGSLLDMLGALLELVVEGVATLIGAAVDAIASLLG
ncbi:MAG: hypothetical protein KF823_15595 [Xanthomonadales bacterium]|nr:hypothetical protein [Xanthomonadales bacterium]